jgi:hypothetical protein
MNIYEKLYYIKQYTDYLGEIYGTEDFSIYLYSLIKMRKPQQIVELGTGLGITALWAGLALEENRLGNLITIDNGSEWPQISQVQHRIGKFFRPNYSDYVTNLISTFNLNAQIDFKHSEINAVEIPFGVDILFSDFSHGPLDILMLFSKYLVNMSDYSVMMFDSASTFYPSYLMLEQLIPMLNSGRIPNSMLEHTPDSEALEHKIKRSSFTLQHIVENKSRAQNSTACIYIQPIDLLPYPKKHLRGFA